MKSRSERREHTVVGEDSIFVEKQERENRAKNHPLDGKVKKSREMLRGRKRLWQEKRKCRRINLGGGGELKLGQFVGWGLEDIVDCKRGGRSELKPHRELGPGMGKKKKKK